MKIGIKDLANRIILLQILWILFFGLVYSYYPQIGMWAYVPDVLNLILIIFVFRKIKYGLKIEYMLFLFFILYALISSLWGDMDWYYIFSNARRYISAFIIYYVSSEYMTIKYWNKGINILLLVQGINVLITMYQNLVMKLHPDFCNGIFGFRNYDNAIQGIFCILISIVAMVYFLDKKWTMLKMIYAIGSSCLVCAFAEIKAYYVLLLFAFFVAFFFRCDDPKLRKKIISFVFVAVLLLFAAYKVLEVIFPANLSTFFNLSQYIMYEQYGAHGGAGRLTSISYIYNNVFDGDIIKTLFGCGLGRIANDYVYTIGKLFVAFGTVGLLLFLIWLMYVCVKYCKNIKMNSENLISVILALMILATLFVWNALFTQVVFLIFWFLGCHSVNQNELKNC